MPAVVRARLPQPVLDVEHVGEVGAEQQRDLKLDGARPVILDGHRLQQSARDLAAPDDRHRRVAVDRSRRLDEEEHRLVVLQRGGRHRVQGAPVEAQLPAGQVPHVPVEQAFRNTQRGIHVPAPVTEHERVPLEDPDLVNVHECSSTARRLPSPLTHRAV